MERMRTADENYIKKKKFAWERMATVEDEMSGTDDDIDEKLLVGVAQEVRAGGVPAFGAENPMNREIARLVEAVGLREIE